jgi:hypothetical protein
MKRFFLGLLALIAIEGWGGNALAAEGIRYVTVTPVGEATALDAGDTAFDRTEIPNAASNIGEPVELVSVVALDTADQTAAVIDLYFLNQDVVFGVLDAAPSISDTDAAALQGWVSLLAADFKDVGGSKIATKANVGLILYPKEGSRSLYFAGTVAGTPTHGVSGLRFRFGFRDVR